MEITLGSQHVVGTRLFRVDWKNLQLTSVAKKDVWLPGEVKRAHCDHIPDAHGQENIKPVENCTCGIWSCKSRRYLHHLFGAAEVVNPRFDPYFSPVRHTYDFEYVSARIEQWGVVIEHEDGHRSEYARIIPESIQAWPRAHYKQHKLIKHLRQKYAVKEETAQ